MQHPDLSRFLTRTTASYHVLEQVGEGTFGHVYKAIDKTTGEMVALKKILFHNESEGTHKTALRELKALECLRHRNVVSLRDVVSGVDDTKDSEKKGVIYMVFDYVEYDLSGLLHSDLPFNQDRIRCYMVQLLTVLQFMHERNYLHRDLKCSNILVTDTNEIKLGDFGLSKRTDPSFPKKTNRVVTLWYRPPELVFGATEYGPEIDIWSLGCIFVEMHTRRPLFPARTETEQMGRIFDLMGTPTLKNWPSFIDLRLSKEVFPPLKRSKFREYAGQHMSDLALAVAERMLTLDPKKRPTAQDVLNMPFFTASPAVTSDELPPVAQYVDTTIDFHEFQAKKRRRTEKSGHTHSKSDQPSGSYPLPPNMGVPVKKFSSTTGSESTRADAASKRTPSNEQSLDGKSPPAPQAQDERSKGAGESLLQQPMSSLGTSTGPREAEGGGAVGAARQDPSKPLIPPIEVGRESGLHSARPSGSTDELGVAPLQPLDKSGHRGRLAPSPRHHTRPGDRGMQYRGGGERYSHDRSPRGMPNRRRSRSPRGSPVQGSRHPQGYPRGTSPHPPASSNFNRPQHPLQREAERHVNNHSLSSPPSRPPSANDRDYRTEALSFDPASSFTRRQMRSPERGGPQRRDDYRGFPPGRNDRRSRSRDRDFVPRRSPPRSRSRSRSRPTSQPRYEGYDRREPLDRRDYPPGREEFDRRDQNYRDGYRDDYHRMKQPPRGGNSARYTHPRDRDDRFPHQDSSRDYGRSRDRNSTFRDHRDFHRGPPRR